MNIFERAMAKYGNISQVAKTIEELSELLVLLVHWINNKHVPDNWQIAEEIADVELMTEQLKYVFNFHEEVKNFKDKKLLLLEDELKK